MWIHTGPEIIKWKCQVPSAEGRGNPVSEWVLVSIKRDIFKKKKTSRKKRAGDVTQWVKAPATHV